MFHNRTNSSCPREDQIISYLYRELTPAETDEFETHLAVCTRCVDELAAVSEPHLSVYQWRTNVFDKIPAPSIKLPVVREQRPHSESLLGRLTALIAGWPVGLRVGVGLAAVLVLGLSLLLINRPFSGIEVAGKIETPQAARRDTVVQTTSSPSVDSTVAAAPSASEVDTVAGASVEPVRAATRVKHVTTTSRKTVPVHAGRTELASTSKPRNRTQRSLRLNNFEEDEDKTLRLADLLEEVGSL